MNATTPYGSHQHAYMEPLPHLPSSHGHTPVSTSQYSHYQQQPQHMVQPSHYAPSNGYYYQPPTPSPQSANHASSHYSGHAQASLPQSITPAAPAEPQEVGAANPPQGFKPKVTATLWEDEGTLCFQIESKGICVARREDNHMINGTKLLNVAGMTRGRRDGILKSEKTRNVVKIGPMHLKGVWIPFERAVEFANKEKITDQLYPLFVHNIGALLHHPQTRDGTRRREETQQTGQQTSTPQYKTPATTQAPPLLQSHSLSTTVGSHTSQTTQALAPHPIGGRPGLDRAHTFPTPPTSASSGLGGMHGPNEWAGYGTSIPVSQSLALDTSGLNNARSMPTTPASTPPGGSLQNLPSYQATHGYDNSRYNATSHSQYPQYPSSVPSQGDYSQSHSIYPTDRGNYTYNPNASLQSEHMTPDGKGSPTEHSRSDRATPRAIATPGSQWHGSYGTPQRAQTIPSSNLTYSVTPDSRGSAPQPNGYSTSANLPSSAPSQQYQYANGTAPSNKRVREVEDDDQDHYQRASSQGSDLASKRRKAGRETSVGGGTGINRSVMAQAS